METRDFICVCLGISSQKVDGICDNFDLDIDSGDVECLLTACGSNYQTFGDRLITDLYLQVIEDAVKYLKLYEDKFDYFVNGQDSHLYYDKQSINSWKELEKIAEDLVEFLALTNYLLNLPNKAISRGFARVLQQRGINILQHKK